MNKNIILIISIGIAICASIFVTNTLTDTMAKQTLIARSEDSADSWVNHFASQIGGFDSVINSGKATTEQVRVLNDARSFIDVFRFKLFDKNGRLILLSDDISSLEANFMRDDESNNSVIEAIASGTQETSIFNGVRQDDRPDWYAETYIPLLQDGYVVGVAEVYVDVSDAYSDIQSGFNKMSRNLAMSILVFSTVPIGIVLWFFHELKSSNQHLKKSRMEAGIAVRAKSQFLANMSHEIRTPMNGVIGMAELLNETKLDAEQRFITHTIVQSATALLEIINDVLDFSKIESGSVKIANDPLDLHSCIEDAVVLLTPAANQKNLELCLNISDDVPIWIKGDGAHLRQCLLNLMGNAVKFTKTGYIEIDASMGLGNELICLINDTGIGIPAGLEAKVFGDFEQVESSETREIEGTGLGLAITRKLILLMGGVIDFTSEVGIGTQFRFSLPLTPIDPPVLKSSLDSIVLKGLHALIVDDLEVNRRILSERLEHFGMTCQIATSYDEAMELLLRPLGKIPFDVAILDHHMPHKSGAELAIAMRGSAKIADLPIVFLSSGSLDSLRDRIKDLGVYEAINKPVRAVDLKRAISRAVGLGGISNRSAPKPSTKSDIRGQFSLRIAIVEDNVINQQLMKQIIGPLVKDFVIWENGEIALSKYEAWDPDLIFMDISMPVMDGLTATREIRRRERIKATREIPIIALTANAMAEDERRCLSAGMTEYLSKPVRKVDILNFLEIYK